MAQIGHLSRTAREMGLSLAETLKGESVVRELRVCSDEDGVELWVVTEPVDIDTEERLYGTSSVLYTLFPGVPFRLHVLNPNETLYQQNEPSQIVPAGTELIRLHADQ